MNNRIAAIIDEITVHRERFERWCRSLSEEELARPVPGSEWVVKDFISHLATIDQTVSRWFAAIAAGGDLNTATGTPEGDRFDIDRWNNEQVVRLRGATLDEIFAIAARTRAEVVSALAQFTDEALDASVHFGGDSKRPAREVVLGRYLAGWAKHDPIHVNDMIRALPERRGDAVVREWLDDPEVGGIARGYAAAMGWREDEDGAAG
ncbi:MAG: hypothetical protein Kow0010_08940 [Dehalococcoidia bacterium]